MTTDPPFRMPVQDTFRIRGRGTVVTGRIERGTLGVGDTVEINRQNAVLRTVVTGIEMFRRQVDQAGVGDYVGVFLGDVGKGDVQRGDTLVRAASDLDRA